MCDDKKLVLIGDPHFSNRKMFGRPTERPGINTRLQYVIDTMKWIANDIPEDVAHVCILGDITHEHGRLDPSVFLAIEEAFIDGFGQAGFPVSILSGNHDIDAYGRSIIPALAGSVEWDEWKDLVHLGPQQLFYSFPLPVHAIPYGDVDVALDYMATLTDMSIVLMHHSFEGAKHGTHEFQPPGGIPPALIPDHITVFSGHYHMRQKIRKNVEYIGAPLQHDFGESNYTPGYVILTISEEGVQQKFVEVPAEVAPRFHILPYNLELGKIPGLPEGDYYRIDLPTDVDPSEIKDLLEHVDNVVVKPIPIDTDMRSRVEEHLQEKGKKVEFVDVMEAYVAMNAEPERAERLLELGKHVVEEAS